MNITYFYYYLNGEYCKTDIKFIKEASQNSIVYIPNEKEKNRIENVYKVYGLQIGWNITKTDYSVSNLSKHWINLDHYLSVLETKIINLDKERNKITEVILSEP